jgi:hypothetical protein
VVEEHLLDRRVERHLLELAEPGRVRDLDDDEPADGIELEAPDLRDRTQLVRVQPVEVADVPVQRADGDDGIRVEQTRGEPARGPVRRTGRTPLIFIYRLLRFISQEQSL